MTLRKLIKLYRRDPLSRWHKLRYSTRRNHCNLLRQIVRRHEASAKPSTPRQIRISSEPRQRTAISRPRRVIQPQFLG
ncbi:hypothetical protein CWO89_01800 [Bradyrhizobium sp. Leo170]|nr:hypothetical protein CWO89_01800 [Bradyrhizobium sp. Leo170]